MVAALLSGCSPGDRPAAEAPVRLSDRLGGDHDAGFARAVEPKTLAFPRDHGPHPAFRNEWWYFTGNLDTPDGRRFGYQVTFFRIALAAERVQRRSAFATRDVWMGHVALSDATAGRHTAHERLTRGAAGLAGAAAMPRRFWIEDWQLSLRANGDWRIDVATPDFELGLDLSALRPVVSQGDRGLSRKSAEAGNASYYYSIPRLKTRGRLRVGDHAYAVAGLSWLDREWSTSALASNQAGWDWFALQLHDGRDLMFYRLRRDDGSADRWSAGSLSDPAGIPRALSLADLALTPTRWWQAGDGVRYPVGWRLAWREGETWHVEAVFDEQRMDLGVRYWEGMVDVLQGAADGELIGRGYLELAGY